MIRRKAADRNGRICFWMFEVIIEKRSGFRWEWRVCDRAGKAIVYGWEETRSAAKYRGDRALFEILLLRVPRLQPPPSE